MTLNDLVDPIEWTWALIAALGVIVCWWALVDSYADRADQRRKRVNGEILTIIHMNLRTARASLILHAFFAALGVLALSTVNPTRVTLLYVLIATGYIVAAASNVRAILLNQIDRVRLRRSALRRSNIPKPDHQPEGGDMRTREEIPAPETQPTEAPDSTDESTKSEEGTSSEE